MAVCRNCRCAKSSIACVSCYPSRKGKCENRDKDNQTRGIDTSSNVTSRSAVSDTSSAADISVVPAGESFSPALDAIQQDIQSFQRGAVLDHIPKGSRMKAAQALSSIINKACVSDSQQDWRKLFRFSAVCFKKSKRGGKRQPSLATLVNRQIDAFLADPFSPLELPPQNNNAKKKNGDDIRAKLVAKKLANCDIKGAVRILSSDDKILPFNDDTLTKLRSKHPCPHPDACLPHPTDRNIETALQLSESQVLKAIQSFPGGSAGGCDLLLPQHLKDLTTKKSGESGIRLLSSITVLCNKMLRGDIPINILPFLYGASMIAFSKPNGGIRPIAIGNTLRRLTAKAAGNVIKEATESKLFPHQLGVAVSGGAEAIVHSARSFCSSNMNSVDPVLFLKIDFENAFNSIRRDKLLRAIQAEMPDFYPFLFQCYSKPSFLFFNGSPILSSEGVQQGDPLGPLSFSLAIQGLITSMVSELNVWYLDDGTLAGKPDAVRSDFEAIIASQESLGLKVNVGKCEFSVLGSNQEANETLASSFKESYPEAKFVAPDQLSLLGTPLFQDALDDELRLRLDSFKITCTRLRSLDHHDALFLLKNVFYIPKLLYILRTSQGYKSPVLKEFDIQMKVALENITNCHLEAQTFRQATLPVKYGGLGVRLAEDISLPAFIASCSKTADTLNILLSEEHTTAFTSSLNEAVLTWKAIDEHLVEPSSISRGFQKSWDKPVAEVYSKFLIENAQDQFTRARLLAVTAPKAGVWLNAIPVPSLGLKLDNESLRISVALRLGAKLNLAYTCVCGIAVEDSAAHGLDCRRAIGKHARHAAINDIVHRALSSAGVPSHLEPVGMCRDDGKRPDGATLIPWKQGKCLVWDVTCVNTIARSHVPSAASQAGLPATNAENKKKNKYSCLGSDRIFVPIALETLGPWGPEADSLIAEVGRRLHTSTGDPRSVSFLRQKISIAVQQGNAMCITGSLPRGGEDF